jgi:hypothetical protein
MKRKRFIYFVLVFAVILLASAAIVLPFARELKATKFSAAVRFLLITNLPLQGPFASFAITNISDRPILPEFCVVQVEVSPISPPPKSLNRSEGTIVNIRMPRDLNLPCHSVFYFHGSPGKFNLLRQKLAGALENIHIRVPGLRPNSDALDFGVETTIPKQN